jgi:GntR family transcriptional regulator/MocR family aminotransferase
MFIQIARTIVQEITLSAQRRMRLLELARAQRMAIVEDDYDHEFHFTGVPVLPLASLDRVGVVIYIGTMSKVLAPGLRIGYVVGFARLGYASPDESELRTAVGKLFDACPVPHRR